MPVLVFLPTHSGLYWWGQTASLTRTNTRGCWFDKHFLYNLPELCHAPSRVFSKHGEEERRGEKKIKDTLQTMKILALQKGRRASPAESHQLLNKKEFLYCSSSIRRTIKRAVSSMLILILQEKTKKIFKGMTGS